MEQEEVHQNQHEHQHLCEHKYLNRKFTNLPVQIKFEEELPINLEHCLLMVEDLIKDNHQNQKQSTELIINETEEEIKLNSKLNKPQQFVLISYHHQSNSNNNNNHKHTHEQHSHNINKHILQEPESNKKTLELLIPLSNVLCVGKRQNQSTILIIKDQEKVIEVDENGYELVSDEDEEEEEFVEETNELYERIKRTVNQIDYEGDNNVIIGDESRLGYDGNKKEEQYMKEQEHIEQEEKPQEEYYDSIKKEVIVINKQCTIDIREKEPKNTENEEITLYQYLAHILEQFERNLAENNNKKDVDKFECSAVYGNEDRGGEFEWEGNMEMLAKYGIEGGNMHDVSNGIQYYHEDEGDDDDDGEDIDSEDDENNEDEDGDEEMR